MRAGTALGAAAVMVFTALAGNSGTASAAPPPKVSEDRAWTTTGDAEGFHLMVADAKDGYRWRTAASLSEPGFDTDMWIGNACVTGSGRRAVVVFAPRTFTNEPRLMARGGFTAVVDLGTGAVTKLALRASLSYYNPGCGVDETAVLTQSPGEDKTSTRLVRLDAATGLLAAPVESAGQVTSAVPVRDGSIVAADAGAVVRVGSDGATTAVAVTDGVPFRLTADKDGGVVFLDKSTAGPKAAGAPAAVPTAKVKRIAGAQIAAPAPKKGKPSTTGEPTRPVKPAELASGPLAATGLARDAAGTVYLTGPVTKGKVKLPKAARLLPKAPKGATVSTHGESVVTAAGWADGKDSRISPDEARDARPVTVDLLRTASGKSSTSVIDPAAGGGAGLGRGKEASPRAAGSSGAGGTDGDAAPRAASAAASGPTEIVESERYCSVPRNDPRNQAMQPKPRQVEWAVDQAIQGTLNQNTSRPANWKNLGMPAYAPQTLFPRLALSGQGRVPAQIMLGITAQESNMWQAGRYVVPGVTGNPLIGNYYGIDYYDGDSSDDWSVNWEKADCGYGVAQITDGMRLAGRGSNPLPYDTQRAVALDYVTNIAAGLRIVSEKWNQTRDAGLIVNNGDASRIENWFFALWAYNSGFHPDLGDGSTWGVGWANNPANPEWDTGRTPFMEDWLGNDDYRDASHPQDWPYQEKVIGFAGHALEALESPGKTVAGYRNAWWSGTTADATVPGSAKYNRAQAKPAEDTFCQVLADDPANNCDSSRISDDSTNDNGPCRLSNLHCWWHTPVTWKADCQATCGNEIVRFNSTYREEPDGTAYPPACTLTGLPAGALIVDDQPDNVPSVRPNCGRPWANAGTFTMSFGSDPGATTFPAKVDTHQIGAGFGGHFYFTHTRKNDLKGQLLKVSATWALRDPVAKPVQVWVHLPDHGAHTGRAVYEVNLGRGKKKSVTVSQPSGKNRWVPLGYFVFTERPSVTLTNITTDGTGDADIAYDAVAFLPVDGTWAEQSFDAVAIFDQDQNMDTDTPWLLKTPFRTMTTLRDWAVERSYGGKSWTGDSPTVGMGMMPVCQGANRGPDCVGPATHAAAMEWYEDARRGGTGHGDSAPDMTQAIWMGYANARPPAEIDPHSSFMSDGSYKIKTHIEARYIVDPTGKIIPGTEQADVTTRTGDTHIAPFVLKMMNAIEEDYGVPAPNLAHASIDANSWKDGASVLVTPNETGKTPGREYLPNVTAPRIVADGRCVESRSVSGGTIGYRPMVANDSVKNETVQWVERTERLAATGYLPESVRKTVGDIYSTFFKVWGPGGTFGTLFNAAPPIWQNVSVAFCADGSVVPTARADTPSTDPHLGIVTQSWMPDLYLYLNGKAIDNAGRPTTGPASRGNFRNFSELPLSDPHPYGFCDIGERGNSGNPWQIDAVEGGDPTPSSGMYCDTQTRYSSTRTD
ncbi:hypothetical protein [Streptomyces sp. TBY4]|uniref:hypothetical protein n=1 Tax=Streptomyces sp. TBY4 TaxID=2962030 RepID=UPI0020B69AEB|nr:hypothetical protein [Streptomyces sp. TBY4]MCP3754327.1 hypothetical protein [Streptomyces sp. TBY4]